MTPDPVYIIVRVITVFTVGPGLRRRHRDDGKRETQQQPRARRQLSELPRDDFGGLADHFLTALATERAADAREQQPHVVVNLGGRADGRSRVSNAVLLA